MQFQRGRQVVVVYLKGLWQLDAMTIGILQKISLRHKVLIYSSPNLPSEVPVIYLNGVQVNMHEIISLDL